MKEVGAIIKVSLSVLGELREQMGTAIFQNLLTVHNLIYLDMGFSGNILGIHDCIPTHITLPVTRQRLFACCVLVCPHLERRSESNPCIDLLPSGPLPRIEDMHRVLPARTEK
jgi:hypothetical protein